MVGYEDYTIGFVVLSEKQDLQHLILIITY